MMPAVDLADLNRKIEAWYAHLVEVEPKIADPERRRQMRQAMEQMRQCQATINAELPKEIEALAARTAAVQKENAETLAHLEALGRPAVAPPAPEPEVPAPPAPIDPPRGQAWRDELLQRYATPTPSSRKSGPESFSGEYSASDPYVARDSEDLSGNPVEPEQLALEPLPDVVAALVKFARLTAADVVYHLGCGDGRLLVSAASIHHARGVGIDRDAPSIAAAQERIRKARLQHLITVAAGDPLEADIGLATVVYLGLGERNGDTLQSLRSQLPPGVRIISHQGPIPGWKPRQEATVRLLDGRPCHLRLWQVGPRSATDSIGGMGESAWDSTS
jgi:hypothetical protein